MKKQVKGKKGILICFCIIVTSVLFFMIYQENAVSFTETTRSLFDGTSTEAEVENQNGAYYKITCKTETFEQDNFLDVSYIDYPVIEFAEGAAEDGLTISLKTGEKVSLNEWKDIDEVFKEINNYRGVIYTSRPFDKSKWEENKDDFIRKWREDENAEYHGYYLYEGRLGLLFNYYQTGREKIALEFEGIL